MYAERGVGIKRVSADGGTAELLIEKKEGERFHGPQALPGEEWVLFTARSRDSRDWDGAQIAVQSLETEERKILVTGGTDARFVPTGHLVYALGNILYTQALNTDSMEVMAGAFPIVEGVARAAVTGSANYGFSDTGMLAHVVGGERGAVNRDHSPNFMNPLTAGETNLSDIVALNLTFYLGEFEGRQATPTPARSVLPYHP